MSEFAGAQPFAFPAMTIPDWASRNRTVEIFLHPASQA
jgi:hypothetical protein